MEATESNDKLAGDCGSGASAQLNNAQTVAIIGANLAAAVAIGAMICVSNSVIIADLHREVGKLEATMEEVRVGLKSDIEGLRVEIKADIERLRTDLFEDTVLTAGSADHATDR